MTVVEGGGVDLGGEGGQNDVSIMASAMGTIAYKKGGLPGHEVHHAARHQNIKSRAHAPAPAPPMGA